MSIYNENNRNLSNVNLKIKSIEFKNIKYKYDEKYVLRNVNFSIKKGELILVTGKSGSGKTTLFKLLCKQFISSMYIIYIQSDKKQMCIFVILESLSLIYQDIQDIYGIRSRTAPILVTGLVMQVGLTLSAEKDAPLVLGPAKKNAHGLKVSLAV